MNLTAYGIPYLCDKAVKGADYIKLYDVSDNCIATFSEISDFSEYTLTGNGGDTAEFASPTATAIDVLTQQIKANALLNNLLQDIKGTTQAITFTDGLPAKILHKDGNGNTVRTDVFTYATDLIIEVRTLNTGETVTFKYHLDTLETEVI